MWNTLRLPLVGTTRHEVVNLQAFLSLSLPAPVVPLFFHLGSPSLDFGDALVDRLSICLAFCRFAPQVVLHFTQCPCCYFYFAVYWLHHQSLLDSFVAMRNDPVDPDCRFFMFQFFFLFKFLLNLLRLLCRQYICIHPHWQNAIGSKLVGFGP